jgi:aminopeptidase N
VTCAAIANGASTQWDFAYQRYLTTNLASEKETLLKALSCSRDTAILSKYGPKYFEKNPHTLSILI